MPYSTEADVEKRLRRALTDAESENIDDLIEEADDLIDAHLGVTEPLNPAPGAVTRVSSRMVADSLARAASNGNAVGVAAMGTTAGPFSQQTTLVQGTGTGGVWLTNALKLSLKRYRIAGQAFTIDTAPVPTESS